MAQRSVCIFILAVALCGSALAQQPGSPVRGVVRDGESGQPLPFATVFVNNTTIGVTTDSVGIFRLKNVPLHCTELVISFVGYETSLKTISLTLGKELVIDIKLYPSKALLNQIVIQETQDKQWKKYYERFTHEFFGKTPNAALCEITNAGELNFTVDDNFNFLATSQRPLQILNHALGYKLEVNLRSFVVKEKESKILYYVQFTELKPKNNRELVRWQIGRLKSYKGSPRHFLKSLIDQRADKEGYRVYYDVAGKLHGDEARKEVLIQVPPEILLPRRADTPAFAGYYKVLQKGRFEVHYLNEITPRLKRVYSNFAHPVSWVTVPTDYLLCPSTGIVKSNSGYFVSGNMSSYRLADILPDDYNPVQAEGTVYLARYAERGSVSGIVKDSVSGESVASANIFINNTAYKAKTDTAGRFKLENIPPGIYELVAAHEFFSIRHRKIEILPDSTTNYHLVMSADTDYDGQDNPAVAAKKTGNFRKYFLSGHRGVRIVNPEAIEINSFQGTIKMRTKKAVELKNMRTGYRMYFYLKAAELSIKPEKKITMEGFTSFDTIAARNSKQRDKWSRNRYEKYRGSISHFLKALVEGRVAEEGFEIFSSHELTGEEMYMRGDYSNRSVIDPVQGDSLLTRTDDRMFELNLPAGMFLKFENGKRVEIESVPGLRLSGLGILSDSNGLQMVGQKNKTPIPSVPLEYGPLNEAIRDPKVWEYVRKNRD